MGMDNQISRSNLNLPTSRGAFYTILKSNLVYLAWFQALIATLGSLFFSEVMELTPCILCWYQRIMMYPLVFVLTIGILLRDQRLRYYTLPLSITGLVISIYHNLLYYNIISESLAPCTTGVSCTTRQIELFGFITIPLMALTAFTVITFSMILYKHGEKIYEPNETTE